MGITRLLSQFADLITLSGSKVTFTGEVAVPAATNPTDIPQLQQVQGPAFSAYQSTAQSIAANTETKLQFQTKEFDTNSNYDNTTNYRFTPTVAGYYIITGRTQPNGVTTRLFTSIFKNGAEYKRSTDFAAASTTYGQGYGAEVVALVYFNGTTDFVEIYAYSNIAINTVIGTSITSFQGVFVRSA